MNNDIQQLRAEVRRRHEAATKKVSRLRRVNGVEIARTNLDPRRDPKKLKGYTRAQLNAYKAELDAFTSRRVGYARGQEGTIPTDRWRVYKSLEKRYNALGQQFENAVGDVFIPTKGMTKKQYDATMKPGNRVSGQGDEVQHPFSRIDRKIHRVKDAKSLEKLIKNMQAKLQPDYLPKSLQIQRKQMNKMLDAIGSAEAKAKAAQLTDEQFNILWNHFPMAKGLVDQYKIFQQSAAGVDARFHATMTEGHGEDIDDLLNYGLALNPQKLPAARGRRREYTDTNTQLINLPGKRRKKN